MHRYRHEISELAAAGIAFGPMIWTADGRPHPAYIRRLQFAVQIAVTRNGQQASAAALISRWKHEIQIAILRRRAAMSRAVLPISTPKEYWLLTGQADRAEGDSQRAVPLEEDLDGREVESLGVVDEEADAGDGMDVS